jgi:hypothetical protein
MEYRKDSGRIPIGILQHLTPLGIVTNTQTLG